jgi:hypothetical protein
MTRRSLLTRRIALAAAVLPVLATSLPLAASAATGRATTDHASSAACSPRVPSASEPSHLAPLTRLLVPGYRLAYCADFTGTKLPWGWDKFAGVPAGDAGGYFEPSHVVVHHGILSINTYWEATHGGVWASGGVCACGFRRTYGAFFVRSRSVGFGPDEVELLWPVARTWPPEVDFNESARLPWSSTWTVHFASQDKTHERTAFVNLLGWHTWGVYWAPHSLTFTVDGFVWGTVTDRRAIPRGAMTLDVQSQSYCGIAPECPTAWSSLQVDWVEEFAPD